MERLAPVPEEQQAPEALGERQAPVGRADTREGPAVTVAAAVAEEPSEQEIRGRSRWRRRRTRWCRRTRRWKRRSRRRRERSRSCWWRERWGRLWRLGRQCWWCRNWWRLRDLSKPHGLLHKLRHLLSPRRPVRLSNRGQRRRGVRIPGVGHFVGHTTPRIDRLQRCSPRWWSRRCSPIGPPHSCEVPRRIRSPGRAAASIGISGSPMTLAVPTASS